MAWDVVHGTVDLLVVKEIVVVQVETSATDVNVVVVMVHYLQTHRFVDNNLSSRLGAVNTSDWTINDMVV